MEASAHDPLQGSLEAGLSAGEVEQHLEEVLESPMFHTSQRSCQFLRYVVDAIIAGHAEMLKERAVGERVFGRQPGYDTGQDSIVRVKASEVRRRLAQYYVLHPEAPVRIELPQGAYTPVFHRGRAWPVEPLPDSPTPEILAPPPPRRSIRWLMALLAIAVLAGSVTAWKMRPASLFGSFWEPFLTDTRDPILCVPTPDTYRIYGSGKAALLEALQQRPPGQPVPALPADAAAAVRIVGEPGKFVGLGDARALTLLYAFAVGHGRSPQIRLGSDTSFTELRAGPDVLIGGFSNHWSMDLVKDARFVFGTEGGALGIVDQSTGKLVCRKPNAWEPRDKEDCAVVTRIVRSKTGNPLLVAAGLDHYGTFGVGEFLTRREVLEPVLRTLPKGWQQRNLQIVFRVEVLRDNVGPPQVLATHVW
jgi:hypothetical protein